jgi:transposase-like protein
MSKLFDFEEKSHISDTFKSSLDEILRQGARQLLQQAIENEVLEYIEIHKSFKDENDRQMVIRNGHLPERSIQTGIGPLSVKQPRIRDKREDKSFTSAILPKYMRKTPSIEAVISTLYLKGISTGNFHEALEAILGKNAKGLSSTNITRLKQHWEADYNKWKARDLSGKHYVYVWVDGIYFNVRLDKDRPCLLVIIGALPDGKKELVGIYDGHRENKLSWKEALIDLREKGLATPPSLAIGDGALGFWSALREIFPETQEQRCWVHKTANILDKMAKSVQNNAKGIIHEMYMSPTKADAIKAMNSFIELYEAKYPKACECLLKDKEELFAFYNFPAEHWQHIRSTNPIESTFATVRHRTRQTKGCGSRLATLTMVFKLVESAQKRWRRLRGYQRLAKVIAGTQFKDGEEVNDLKQAV